jgi:hypothetical protein
LPIEKAEFKMQNTLHNESLRQHDGMLLVFNSSNSSWLKSSDKKCYFLHAVDFDSNQSELFISSIITLILNALFGIVASCGNIIFIVSLWKTNTLHTSSNLLLGNLAIADLLVGLLVQPLYVAYKAGELNGKYTCFVHISFSTLAWLAVGVSFLTLTTISFERYIAILKPFFYLTLLQERNVVVVSVLIWLISLALVFSRFVGVSSFLFYAICCTIIVISFTTTTFIYIKIFRLAKHHHKSIIDTRHHESVKNGRENLVQETKLTKTIGLVTGIFFLSYVPTLCIMVYYSIRGYGRVVKTVYSWPDTILFVNSSLNPFIYYMRNQQIRQGVLNMLKRFRISKSPDALQPPTVSFSRKRGIIKITKQPNQEIPDV